MNNLSVAAMLGCIHSLLEIEIRKSMETGFSCQMQWFCTYANFHHSNRLSQSSGGAAHNTAATATNFSLFSKSRTRRTPNALHSTPDDMSRVSDDDARRPLLTVVGSV